MDIAFLGSLRVSQDGELVLVRGTRERTLLVALASRAGKLVRTEELIDALWAEHLPGDPMNSLHAAVSRLRRQLPSVGPSPLQISGTGYLQTW
jgi:DNA-binding SARP family transcriptional activator